MHRAMNFACSFAWNLRLLPRRHCQSQRGGAETAWLRSCTEARVQQQNTSNA